MDTILQKEQELREALKETKELFNKKDPAYIEKYQECAGLINEIEYLSNESAPDYWFELNSIVLYREWSRSYMRKNDLPRFERRPQEPKGLMETIEKELGYPVKEKIEDISFRSDVFVLFAVSVSPKTQEQIDKDYAAQKLKYKKMTKEYYLDMLKHTYEDKFNIFFEPNAYFIDEKEAQYYIENNMADINDGGAYEYAMIIQYPLNQVYPMPTQRTLYKYVRETDRYAKVDYSDEPVVHDIFGKGYTFCP